MTALQQKGLSINEAKVYLGGISHMQVYRLIHSGDLRSYKIGTRRFVQLDSLNDYITQQLERSEV